MTDESDDEGAGVRAKDKAAKEDRKGEPSLDDSVRKADRLFANQEWSAAAAAYRDLLSRFPTYKDAAKWRERMNAALVAAQENRRPSPAKGAKAAKVPASGEPLDGDMR